MSVTTAKTAESESVQPESKALLPLTRLNFILMGAAALEIGRAHV